MQAKAVGEPSADEMKRMLQSLLEDRFGLVTHRESREMRYFAMVLARSDGRPGPYLHRAPDTGPCISRQELAAIEKARSKPSVGYAMAGMSCGALTVLAELASRNVALPVFDRTGLTGRWSADIYFAPDPNVRVGRPFGQAPVGAAVTPDPNLASFAVALQEQLGLKLEPTRGPVDVLVIDAVRQPTDN